MIAHFQSLEGDLAKWTLFCFLFKGALGIKQKLLECLEGVSKNRSLGSQIFNTIMSMETELDS